MKVRSRLGGLSLFLGEGVDVGVGAGLGIMMGGTGVDSALGSLLVGNVGATGGGGTMAISALAFFCAFLGLHAAQVNRTTNSKRRDLGMVWL